MNLVMKSFIVAVLPFFYIIHSLTYFLINYQPMSVGGLEDIIYGIAIPLVPSPLYPPMLTYPYLLKPFAYNFTLSTIVFFVVNSLIAGLFVFGLFKKSKWAWYTLIISSLIHIPMVAYHLAADDSAPMMFWITGFTVSLFYLGLCFFIRSEYR